MELISIMVMTWIIIICIQTNSFSYEYFHIYMYVLLIILKLQCKCTFPKWCLPNVWYSNSYSCIDQNKSQSNCVIWNANSLVPNVSKSSSMPSVIPSCSVSGVWMSFDSWKSEKKRTQQQKTKKKKINTIRTYF